MMEQMKVSVADLDSVPLDHVLSEAGGQALVRHEGKGSEGFLEHVFKYAAKELFGLNVDQITYKTLRTHGKMLLLFLSLGLFTSNVQSEKQGVNVTCENQSVVAGQNHNLTCRVDYSHAYQNKKGDVGNSETGCKTEQYFWKDKSKTPIRNCDCTKDCNTTITTNTYFCEIKNVTKADEGNYTFTINTNCGNGHGTLNVSVKCEYNVNIQ
uniref:Immunoglobulin domain-containing protein n=1 Tax=Oncorhynchus tshawytscha TaxID=74940 RepID=A0AAZ3QGR4_ONCTS